MRHLAQARNPYSRSWLWIPGSLVSLAPRNDEVSKPPRAHLDLFLGEKNLLGVFDNVLSLPSRVRRLPARLLHHPHLADAARTGDAEDLAGLVARQIADHV